MGADRSKSELLPLRERELIRAHELAALLGLKRTAFYKLRKAGAVPDPLVLAGGQVVWRRREFLDWVDAGCPSAVDWKWTPTVPVNLERLVAALSEEAAGLMATIEELKRRQAAEQTTVLIGRNDR